jgi:hypothetical protein
VRTWASAVEWSGSGGGGMGSLSDLRQICPVHMIVRMQCGIYDGPSVLWMRSANNGG